MKLSVALRDGLLVARYGDEERWLHDPAELLELRRCLVNECHERRIPLSGGAFDPGVEGRRGSLPARMQLAIGDRMSLSLQIGQGTSTWSYAKALEHYGRTWSAVSALLRVFGVLEVTSELLEHIELFEQGSSRELGGLTLEHLDEEHAWAVDVPCDTIADLSTAIERIVGWAERCDGSLEIDAVAFIGVLAPELYINLSWLTTRKLDEDAELIRALAFTEEEPEALLFRVHRKQMSVGIRQSGGRVWILLEPRADRVVKSNDDTYSITLDDLDRMRKAARLKGAVERELLDHLQS